MSCIHCVQAMHIFFAKFARAAHTIYRGVSSAHGAGATDDEKVPTTCQKQPQSVATDVWKYFTKIFPNKICLKKGWELCQIILVRYQSTLFTLFYIFFLFQVAEEARERNIVRRGGKIVWRWDHQTQSEKRPQVGPADTKRRQKKRGRSWEPAEFSQNEFEPTDRVAHNDRMHCCHGSDGPFWQSSRPGLSRIWTVRYTVWGQHVTHESHKKMEQKICPGQFCAEILQPTFCLLHDKLMSTLQNRQDYFYLQQMHSQQSHIFCLRFIGLASLKMLRDDQNKMLVTTWVDINVRDMASVFPD